MYKYIQNKYNIETYDVEELSYNYIYLIVLIIYIIRSGAGKYADIICGGAGGRAFNGTAKPLFTATYTEAKNDTAQRIEK